MKILSLVALFCTIQFATHAHAGSPLSNSLAGVTLGNTPAQTKKILKELYGGCEIDEMVYKNGKDPLTHIGQLEIGSDVAGEECRKKQEDSGRVDELSVLFVHPEVDQNQPAFQIRLVRVFQPNSNRGKPSFKEIIDSIQEKFGPPAIEKFEKASKRPFNRGAYLYIYKAAWTAKPQRDALVICFDNSCGKNTLQLSIMGEGPTKATLSTARITNLTILDLVDQELYSKQIEWEVRQDDEKEKRAKSF